MYKFTDREPLHPYIKRGVKLQFWEEVEEARETEEVIQGDGSIEVKIVARYYNKYHLAWREEFSQGAEYDEEGNLIKESYITENYEALLAEAKEQI